MNDQIKEIECNCGNSQFFLECVCDFVNTHKGNKNFGCGYCGFYTASNPRCNECEEFEEE